MMFCERSCSPAEMKILVPVILWLPSLCGTALLRSRPRSVPQCGSVRFIVPVQTPSTIFGRYFAFNAGEACASNAAMAPCVRPGYMAKAMLAEQRNSLTTSVSVAGVEGEISAEDGGRRLD